MNHIHPTFDSALLGRPAAERLTYFQRKVIAHDHLLQAFNLTLDNIDFIYSGEIVPVVGPTGVGTSALGRKIWHEYQRQGQGVGEMQNHQVSVNASAIGINAPFQSGRIDVKYWCRLLSDILRLGGDMLIDRKIYVPPHEFTLTHPLPVVDPRAMGIDALISAAVSMLKRRQTKVVLINQAERLFPASDAMGCERSQQILLDLASQTDTRFVLIGGYQIVHACCDANNWLSRQHIVHFRRYDRHSTHEYEMFVQVLISLLASMPTDRRLEKISESGAEKFYLSSIGCIGSLKKTLLMAFQHSLRTGEPMTEQFILGFALRNVTALGVAKDARLGEARLTDVGYSEVQRALETGVSDSFNGQSANTPAKSHRGTAASRPSPVVRRIGERKPTRDPVGGRHA